LVSRVVVSHLLTVHRTLDLNDLAGAEVTDVLCRLGWTGTHFEATRTGTTRRLNGEALWCGRQGAAGRRSGWHNVRRASDGWGRRGRPAISIRNRCVSGGVATIPMANQSNDRGRAAEKQARGGCDYHKPPA
jgi:hypothetical protein